MNEKQKSWNWNISNSEIFSKTQSTWVNHIQFFFSFFLNICHKKLNKISCLVFYLKLWSILKIENLVTKNSQNTYEASNIIKIYTNRFVLMSWVDMCNVCLILMFGSIVLIEKFLRILSNIRFFLFLSYL